MFARVSIMQGKPEQIEAGIANYKNQMLPEARKMSGFKGAYLLVDRKTGKNLGITLWDSENNLKASAEAANRLREKGASSIAAFKPPIVEIYEVAVQE